MAVGGRELKEMRDNLGRFHQRNFISILSRTFGSVFAEKILHGGKESWAAKCRALQGFGKRNLMFSISFLIRDRRKQGYTYCRKKIFNCLTN